MILKSDFLPRLASIAVKKLGQPVPESYFHSDLNSGRPQPRQTKVPCRCSFKSGLV